MSALNVVVQPEAVHILTDGAGYRASDGEVLYVAQKVATIAYLPAALAVRGALMFLPILSEEINGRVASFDELVDCSVELVRTTATAVEEVIAKCGATNLDIVLAGWSARRDRPEAYAIFNHDGYGIPAWELTPLECGLVQPCDEDFRTRLQAIGIDLTSTAFDPARDGLRLMCEQRAIPWKLGNSELRAVGGFCQLTTVSRDAIATRVLVRWPDRIGARIEG